jgi:hypothetical protein
MASTLSVEARTAARQAKLAAELEQELGRALPRPTVAPVTRGGILRALRLLGQLEELTAEQAKALRAKLVSRLAEVFKSMKFDPKDFGVSTPKELADVFVQMLERVRYNQYTRKQLLLKIKGLKGVFAGELFERLVHNMRELNADLDLMATVQRNELNTLARQGSPHLLNAVGDPVKVKGTFGQVKRATDIFIWKGGKKLKFVDTARVAYNVVGDERRVGMLVETEIKLPAAAKEFGPQIGAARERFAGAEAIEMVVDGETAVFAPEDVIFSRRSVNRTAITTSVTGTTEMRFSFNEVRKGVPNESFLRVDVAVSSQDVYKLASVAF